MSDDLVKDSASAEPEFTLNLKRFTPARVSLGQAGPAIPTHEQLRFQLDHARARDAVHARLDVAELLRKLHQRGMDSVALRSVVARGGDRSGYLRRPDLGRKLDAKSAEELKARAAGATQPDVAFVIVDGLSALAVEMHAIALLDEIRAGVGATVSVAPISVVSDGRVAIGDEIGLLLRAKLAVVLIGERPGLSSPDSLGVYITWDPKPGRTDAERNCISNIRREGLSYSDAAQRILYYMREAQRLGKTGVMLKERPGIAEPLRTSKTFGI
jgi:ethanolamine ammonia-lyase small subunit